MSLLILSCIWDHLGDIVFALQIRNAFADYSPKIIFYFKDPSSRTSTQLDYIKSNVTDYELCVSAADVVNRHKRTILQSNVILNTTPKYNQMLPLLQKINYKGKYYRICDYGLGKGEYYKHDSDISNQCAKKVKYPPDTKHDIYTGFGKASKGIFITDEVPTKTFSWWEKKYYDYDQVFTCYLHTAAACNEFLDFINENFKRSLVIVQGKSLLDEFKDLPTVRESTYGKVTRYSPNVHVLAGVFTLPQSQELFYYSHPITAATGNNSMSLCISYNKVQFLDWRPEMSPTLCLFYDFLRARGYDQLTSIFKYLIDRQKDAAVSDPLEYIEKHRPLIEKFNKDMIQNFNLQKNIRGVIVGQLSETSYTGGSQMDPELVRKLIIAVIILIILAVLWQILKATGLVTIDSNNSQCTIINGVTTCA